MSRRRIFAGVTVPGRRRPRRRFRSTHVLGVAAVATTGAVVALEYAHVWRRGRAPLPSEADHVLEAGREAAVETVEVAVEAIRAASPRETALLNLLIAFTGSFGVARVSTHAIRARGPIGPFRNFSIGQRHIHHFVPGIVLSLAAGGASIVSRNEEHDKWFALPFGLGAALTLDEAALLIELEDVYWTEEGVLSVQVALSAIALLGMFALVRRLLARGEQRVLESADAAEAR